MSSKEANPAIMGSTLSVRAVDDGLLRESRGDLDLGGLGLAEEGDNGREAVEGIEGLVGMDVEVVGGLDCVPGGETGVAREIRGLETCAVVVDPLLG